MLTAFDVGFGVLVLISAILATARGLTREILSLVTWLGSAAIAAYMYFKHPDLAQHYIKDALVANAATVVVSFIVSLIILHLITMRIADFVVESRIGALDRTLGFVFGVLRGVLIAIVVVFFGLWLALNETPDKDKAIDTTNLPSWASWAKDSVTLPYLAEFGGDLRAALPEDADVWLTNLLKRNSGATTPAAGDTGAAAGDDSGDQSPPDAAAAPDSTAPDTTPDDSTTTPDATKPPPAPAAPANGGA